jgi:hypothetical protein
MQEVSEHQYEAAWRAGQWSLEVKQSPYLEGREMSGFHAAAFYALRYSPVFLVLLQQI